MNNTIRERMRKRERERERVVANKNKSINQKEFLKDQIPFG